jgi:hypothetical protein
MTNPEPDEDLRLVHDLRAAVHGVGTPTARMMAAAQAAYSWRTVDAELVALTHDSLTDETTLVRGGSAVPRTLVFEGPQLSVELEQTDEGVVGQLVPPTDGEVTLLGPDGELGHASVDEMGCFSFDRAAHGPVRLRCRTSSAVVITEWISL